MFGVLAASAAYVLVAVQIYRIRSIPLIGSRILRIYIAYGILAYVVRGIYLVWSGPKPAFNDPMPIGRLYEYGYGQGVARILWFQTGSLACIGLVVWLLSRTQLLQTFAQSKSGNQRLFRLSAPLACGLTIAYASGWAARLFIRGISFDQGTAVDLAGGSFGKVSNLAFLVPALLLVSTEWFRPKSLERRLLYFIVPLEVAWAFLGNTKAPVVGVVIAAYLGSPTFGSVWSRVGHHRKTLLLASCLSLVFFSIINGSREPRYATTSRSSALASATEDLFRSPGEFTGATVRRLLVRLDGLKAAAAAYLEPPGRYMDIWEAGRRSAELSAPSILTGTTKETPGLLWAHRMEGTTYDVALAEGVAAEGYAIGGTTFSLIWSTLMAGMLVLAFMMFNRSPVISVSRFFAVGFIASPALFERGLLGNIEHAINALQLGILGWIIVSIGYAMVAKGGKRNSRPFEGRSAASSGIVSPL